MSSSVLLDTLGQKTNSLAFLSVVKVGYTFVQLKFKNTTDKEETYRITRGNPTDSKRSYVGPETTYADRGNYKHTYQSGLRPGSMYCFFLERKENGQWVEQSAPSKRKYVQYTTYKMAVSSSTSTTSALLTWPKLSKSDHRVDIYDTKASSGVKRLPTKRLISSSVKTSGKTATVTVTGLEPDKVYYTSVLVKEPSRDGSVAFVAATADEFEFETSDRANLTIDPAKTLCSSVTMSWDKGRVGLNEADNRADFYISGYVRKGSEWKSVAKLNMPWTTEGKKTFTPKGLEPGKLYKFSLYRRGVDGGSVPQMSAEVTTKATDVTISNRTSTRAVLNWEPVYDRATYSKTAAEIMFSYVHTKKRATNTQDTSHSHRSSCVWHTLTAPTAFSPLSARPAPRPSLSLSLSLKPCEATSTQELYAPSHYAKCTQERCSTINHASHHYILCV